MDYKEYSKNSVDALLDSLLYGGRSDGAEGAESVFPEETHENHADLTLDPQELHRDNNLITFSVGEEMPMQFTLASQTAPGAGLFSSSSSSLSSHSPVQARDAPKPIAKKAVDIAVALDTPSELESGPFVCHYCDASFRMRGYLTRHIKKHAIEKAYKCPFFSPDAPPELRCHTTGGFSRRDTYKTHLKARHLAFPAGVRPQDRNRSPGHCTQCGERCGSTENWVEQHIETGECSGLPADYVRTVKSERKSGKLRVIKTSNGHSRFISTAKSVIEPKILMNKEALEAIAIVAKGQSDGENESDVGSPEQSLQETATLPSSPSSSTVYPPLDDEQAPIHTEQPQETVNESHDEPHPAFAPGRLYERDFTTTRRYNRLYDRLFR